MGLQVIIKYRNDYLIKVICIILPNFFYDDSCDVEICIKARISNDILYCFYEVQTTRVAF